MKIIFLLLLVVMAGCGPATFGPIQIHPQDESLFHQGLQRWQEGDSEPQAFTRLRTQFPHSPLAVAAGELLEGHRKAVAEAERNHFLEQQLAQLKHDFENCRDHNLALTKQVRHLEISLEQFKQILLDTEGR
ncbi:hypothetical protein SAMN05660860_00478 [Geoalkalibacter ferrihydriticus]|uniref:DUF4398 domain-containing protein n=2 Tax=Geoalkalibacter ferrihydriticus TaxID=392333 RepID=A0A0C2DUB2_9BACT|nr:hypothetical protein [Geoalkalibacter ferrihydriticus]KIH77039.1 hypothetical protein GFER_08300 [Geoalkalibacter ferrihydriticus DSM 17813]SDL37677.1 hypothetical protein SAMN05660860_00478 [Geoalkalibacter ferrihydriticus]